MKIWQDAQDDDFCEAYNKVFPAKFESMCVCQFLGCLQKWSRILSNAIYQKDSMGIVYSNDCLAPNMSLAFFPFDLIPIAQSL